MIDAYKFEIRCHVGPRNGYDGFWRGKQFWPTGVSTKEVVVIRDDLLLQEASQAEAKQALQDGAITASAFDVLLSDQMVGAQVLSSRKARLNPKPKAVKPKPSSLLDELDQDEATRPSKATK